jgi:FkbM family methyltransferase
MDNLNKILFLVLEYGERLGDYLHVGAFDGVTDCITYPLYEAGWRGVCIEPQTEYYNQGRANRPEDTWIKGVCVGRDYEKKQVKFFVDPTGRFSGTIDNTLLAETYHEQVYADAEVYPEFPGMISRRLKAIKVNEIVPREPFDTGLDLLVVDTNGTEAEVMTAVNLGTWKPHLVVIPDEWYPEGEVERYMNSMGYYLLAKGKTDTFNLFSNNYEDIARV